MRFVAADAVRLSGDLTISGAAHAEFDNMTIGGWYVGAGSDDITLRDVRDVGGLDINSADNVSWIGGSMGPGQNWDPEIKYASGSSHPPTNILFDGVTFHDWIRTNGVSHVDCLHVMAVDHLTIENSVFYNCEAFDLIFTDYGGPEPSHVTLENNWFQCCRTGYYSIYVGNLNGGTIRFNSSDRAPYVASTNETATGGDVRDLVIDSNIWPSINPILCAQAGTTWEHNVVGRGGPCAHGVTGDPRFVADGTGVPPPGTPAVAPDFRIQPGSSASGAGNAANYPPTNIRGRPRTAPPDAGAW